MLIINVLTYCMKKMISLHFCTSFTLLYEILLNFILKTILKLTSMTMETHRVFFKIGHFTQYLESIDLKILKLISF